MPQRISSLRRTIFGRILEPSDDPMYNGDKYYKEDTVSELMYRINHNEKYYDIFINQIPNALGLQPGVKSLKQLQLDVTWGIDEKYKANVRNVSECIEVDTTMYKDDPESINYCTDNKGNAYVFINVGYGNELLCIISRI